MDINYIINELLKYALDKELIEEIDKFYCANKLLNLLNINEFNEIDIKDIRPINEILDDMLDYAFEHNIINSNDVTTRDLFDTKIMDIVTPRPSFIVKKFWELYEKNPLDATNYFYKLSIDCDYIRMDRINKNINYKYNSKYGNIDITINLSKPEKDPKMIALAKSLPSSNYPKCPLCKENVGYKGSIKNNSRDTLRIIPMELSEEYNMQYSPYVYYNEHCIVFNNTHKPMKIDEVTFMNLCDFVDTFPHYFIGSNADLPIVGGSILSHDHYQGGKYYFSMFDANVLKEYNGFNDVKVSYINWPLDTIRLVSKDKEALIRLANKILNRWREYEDKDINIFHKENNTITPICKLVDNHYCMYLVLRNNYSDDKHPLGMYHPNESLWHIKKENIGLIEVMGMAILPARLKNELKELEEILLDNSKEYLLDVDPLNKHKDWYYQMKNKYQFNKDNVDKILKDEVGEIFTNVLEDCSVFKYANNKIEAMDKFIKFVKEVR